MTSSERAEDLASRKARITSINTSRGGVPKTAVFEALVGAYGLDGDHQRDPRYHGGPDRAVVLYSLELIEALQREGHPIGVGTTGENITVSGLDWASLTPGREIAIGDVRLVVTKYVAPCEKISDSFRDGDFTRIAQKQHPGWSRVSARVITGGVVRPGDRVELCN